MSIKGLTDRGLAFPIIGTIRKGAKKDPKVNRPGTDLSYFRVEFDEMESEAAQTFFKLYGPEPKSINVFLPFDDIERCWDAWLEAYTAGRLVARSDGENFEYLIDTSTGEVVVKNGIDIRTGTTLPYRDGTPVGYYMSKGQQVPIYCKPTGRLKVILPELRRACYLQLTTTSTYDIMAISEQLAAIKSLSGGRLAIIPLVIKRKPRQISCPNQDGTRVRRTKYLISIEADPSWVKKSLDAAKVLVDAPLQPALPEGGPGDVDETHIVDHDEGELEETVTSESEYVEIGMPPMPDVPTEPSPAPDNPEPVQPAMAVPAQGELFLNGHTAVHPLQYLVDAGLVENTYGATSLVNNYVPNPIRTNKEKVLRWARLYRGWRDTGLNPAQAASAANEGREPK